MDVLAEAGERRTPKKRGAWLIAGMLLLTNLAIVIALPGDADAGATRIDILRPILSVPSILELGGELNLEVDSDATPSSSWNVTVATIHDQFSLPVINASLDGGVWKLNVSVPQTFRPDLYDLTVAVDGVTDTEPHAVSVVNQFKDRFSFIQMTDIHIRDAPSANEDNLRRAIAEANLIHPEFVVISGDIGDNPEGVGQDEVAEYQRVRNLLLEFDVPVYVVNGNHDYDSDLFEPSPIDVYRDLINPYPDFSFDYGEFHFAGLDSGEKTAYYGLPGCMMGTGLTNAQLSWLDADLGAHSDSKQRFVFMHHTALDPDDVYDMGFYWNSSISQNQPELLELARQRNVTMVLTGHTHVDEVWDGNGSKQTGGSIGDPQSPLYVQTRATGKGGAGEVGYRLVRANGTALESYTYDWDGNGLRDAERSIPSYNLDSSFSPSNNGTSRTVTATVTNDLREDFPGALLEFVMPKPGSEYQATVANGSIAQKIETQSSIIYQVMADIPMLSTVEVVLLQNELPSASFDVSPSSPTTADLLYLNDSSLDLDGTIVGWSWDFGDGKGSTDRNATHTYGAPGNYTVTLVVIDSDGAWRSALQYITVSPVPPPVPPPPEELIDTNSPPTALFSHSPANPVAGGPIQFTDLSTDPDGSIVSRSWEFGDGGSGTGASPLHIYSEPGRYVVNLTVTDDGGAEGTETILVVVVGGSEAAWKAIPFQFLFLLFIPLILIILIFGRRRRKRKSQGQGHLAFPSEDHERESSR